MRIRSFLVFSLRTFDAATRGASTHFFDAEPVFSIRFRAFAVVVVSDMAAIIDRQSADAGCCSISPYPLR
ncbi:MAG TPA: hypothetical protein VN688_26590 [Gemmataceae bacterium]|nr:hypothetical protein [Gemmataceae bacterium]